MNQALNLTYIGYANKNLVTMEEMTFAIDVAQFTLESFKEYVLTGIHTPEANKKIHLDNLINTYTKDMWLEFFKTVEPKKVIRPKRAYKKSNAQIIKEMYRQKKGVSK